MYGTPQETISDHFYLIWYVKRE